MNIDMTLHMCAETGKPYYYGKTLERIYELPSLLVPEHLKQYLVTRGHVFHEYTSHFNENDRFNVSVEEFLACYPTWEEVKENDFCEEEGWLEEDHANLKELLEWCEKQPVSFRVSWSY